MTVLFIGVLPPHPGGGSSHSAQILSGLEERGHTVIAISPLAAGHRQHDRSRISTGVTIHPVPIGEIRIPSNAQVDAQARGECRQIVEIARRIASTEPPDVVLLSRADLKDAAIEIAALLDVPLVMVDHGSASAHLNGFCGFSEAYRLGRLVDEADCIVSVAEHRAAVLRANGIRNVVAIPNAVNTKMFRPGPACPQLTEELGVPSTSRLIAHVSNMKPLKRIVDYLSAVASVVRQEPKLHALVVGEGTGRADYEDHARSLGIAKRVTFTGWLDHERLAALYRTVEMVVQPSQIEAAPLVTLEAIASQCPVVATDIPAYRDIMEHDRTGVLVPTCNADALAHAILDLMRAPDRRHRIAVEAYAKWSGRSVDKMIARYGETLSHIAKSGRGRLTPEHEREREIAQQP